MSDRRLGYLVISVLLILVLIFGSYFVWVTNFPADRRILRFTQIGNLKIEDPVVQYGKTIGKVDATVWTPTEVLVTIECPQHLELRSDYHISIEDKGLMGERVVAVEPGTDKHRMLSPRDTLVGEFKPGVSEAIGLVSVLRDYVSLLRSQVSVLRNGSGSTQSFPRVFARFEHDVDSLVNRFTTLAKALPGPVASAIGDANKLADQVGSITDKAAIAIPEYKSRVQGILSQADSLVESLQGTLDATEALVAKVEDPSGVLWQDDLRKIHTSLIALRSAVRELDKNGVGFQVQVLH